MSYDLKEWLAAAENYGAYRAVDEVRYLVIHYTGNAGDTAAENAAYFRNHIVKASAHYFVDDSTVYRSVPEEYRAWAVGGSLWADHTSTGGGTLYGVVTNGNSISVELCGTAGDGTTRASEKTLENAATLCRKLMKQYNIPVERVVRHFDVTGKHCPAYLMDEAAWAQFKTRLVKQLDNQPAAYAKEAVRWAQIAKIMVGDEEGDLKLNQPVTRQQMVTMLHRYHRYLDSLIREK